MRILKPALATATLMMLTASCGSRSSSSSLLDTPSGNQPAKMIFTEDKRPVDGALTEILLEKSAAKKYDLTITRKIVSRSTGAEGSVTIKEVPDMSCEFSTKLIFCAVDKRTVDGALHELSIVKNNDTYSAKLRTVIVSRQDGQSYDTTTDIANELILGDSSGSSSIEISGKDGDKLFAALRSLGVVDTDRLVGATNLRIKELRCDTNLSDTARGILCRYVAVNASTGKDETFTRVSGKDSDTLFNVLAAHGLSVPGGFNPNFRAIAVNSLVCSQPVIPNPVASCVAERL